MNNSIEEISTNEIETRELLYALYADIMKEINNKKIDIDSEEYIKKIATTSISTLVLYIKESINLLVNKRIEKYKNEEKKILNDIPILNDNEIERKKYENLLKYFENQIRYNIKQNLKLKLEKENLEAKIKIYMEIKEEYDEMREKLRYEDGKFLDNDRKENEIEILRLENTNLKVHIKKLEKNKIFYQSKIKIDDEMINELKNKLEKLENKVAILLKNNNDDFQNINNKNNNLNQSSKLIIKDENNRKIAKLIKRHSYHNFNNNEKSENYLSDIFNIKTLLNLNNGNSINSSNQKKRTNSMNLIKKKKKTLIHSLKIIIIFIKIQ